MEPNKSMTSIVFYDVFITSLMFDTVMFFDALPVSFRAPLGPVFGGRGRFGLLFGISGAVPGTSGERARHFQDASRSNPGRVRSLCSAFGLPWALSGNLRDQIWCRQDRILRVVRAYRTRFVQQGPQEAPTNDNNNSSSNNNDSSRSSSHHNNKNSNNNNQRTDQSGRGGDSRGRSP